VSMQEFKVRVATKKDARTIEDAILEWSRELWPTWQPERTRTIHKVLKDKSHLLLISTAPQALVGILHLIFYPDVVSGSLNCHLNFLLTKKEHRKKGVGRSLIDEAVRYARSRGVNEMHVDTKFEEAAEFYRKYGFKDDGVWLELSLMNQGVP
jgi:GNAT superfamily N-acetyltransferase